MSVVPACTERPVASSLSILSDTSPPAVLVDPALLSSSSELSACSIAISKQDSADPMMSRRTEPLPDDVMRLILRHSLSGPSSAWQRSLLHVCVAWDDLVRCMLPDLPNITLYARGCLRRTPVVRQPGVTTPTPHQGVSLRVEHPSYNLLEQLVLARWRSPINELVVRGRHEEIGELVDCLAYSHFSQDLTSVRFIETNEASSKYTMLNRRFCILLSRSSLTSFSYSGGHAVDAALLNRIPTLTSLRLAGARILSPELIRLPHLRTLVFSDLRHGSEPLLCIANHPRLTRLHLTSQKSKVHRMLLALLPSLEDLVVLELPTCPSNLSASVMTAVSQMPSVSTLHLAMASLPLSRFLTTLHVKGVAGCLCQSTTLVNLQIGRSKLDTEDLACLPACATHVTVPYCYLHRVPSEVRSLASFPSVMNDGGPLHNCVFSWSKLSHLCLTPAWKHQDRFEGQFQAGGWDHSAGNPGDVRNMAVLVKAKLDESPDLSDVTFMMHVRESPDTEVPVYLLWIKTLQRVTLVYMEVSREQLHGLAAMPVMNSITLIDTIGATEQDCADVSRDAGAEGGALEVTFLGSLSMFGHTAMQMDDRV